MEVHDIVQEAALKIIPKKKKCKKAKWLSEEALQRAEKRKDEKGKREKERYTHLNAEFQRIARKDKKPTSVINAKMGAIQDINSMDLTKAGDIKKR